MARPKSPEFSADPSRPLTNPRHELFANLLATGKSPMESYISAGFSKGGAASAASKLQKIAHVKARIEQLRAVISGSVLQRAIVDREWVLHGLKGIAEDKEEPASARVQAYVKVGEDLGMFRQQHDHTLKWDGDLAKLDAPQLQKLMFSLETMIGDPAVIAAAKAEAAKELVQ